MFPQRFESEDYARRWFCPKLRFSLSSWFPHRFEFEDHARPWFCPKHRFSLSNSFPFRFEFEDHTRPWFCPKLIVFLKVVGFPIGLSSTTMQGLGSVQNLDFL